MEYLLLLLLVVVLNVQNFRQIPWGTDPRWISIPWHRDLQVERKKKMREKQRKNDERHRGKTKNSKLTICTRHYYYLTHELYTITDTENIKYLDTVYGSCFPLLAGKLK